ncbi:MAG: DNA glycosylase [Methanocorpusculum sp.]|uniref:DNA glycosylase n=1 Tax=Methanocorpusculum sp. TaxID=2058474 RepID=UPI00271A26D4|nr:DNA glycosylase [Methanocorpusculum sp.]MDO9523322.1 DNA glycosylase [Methanocorpusculum sp.]
MQTFSLKNIPFQLDRTVSCGQAFRWRQNEGFWYAPIADRVWKIRQEGDILWYEGPTEDELVRYFGLDVPLDRILNDIDTDPLIHAAIEQCRGLRIIRQDPWECLVSYICATCANIPGIMLRIENLSMKYGRNLELDGQVFHTFPDAEILCKEDICAVRACKVGYRDAYICKAAEMAANDPHWAEEIQKLPYHQAKEKLMTLPGVGPKVADCVLLFAFEKYEAFPVDVWIERILRTKYLGGTRKLSYKEAGEFARNHFGQYAGYAQEYLFGIREEISSKGE